MVMDTSRLAVRVWTDEPAPNAFGALVTWEIRSAWMKYAGLSTMGFPGIHADEASYVYPTAAIPGPCVSLDNKRGLFELETMVLPYAAPPFTVGRIILNRHQAEWILPFLQAFIAHARLQPAVDPVEFALGIGNR